MLLWLCGIFADNIWMFLCLVFWIVFAKIDVEILPLALVENEIAMVAGWRLFCFKHIYSDKEEGQCPIQILLAERTKEAE